jgi:hypothetical protein
MKVHFTAAEGYRTPLCQIVEVSQEGMLCTSTEKEYNSTLDDYVIKDESYW